MEAYNTLLYTAIKRHDLSLAQTQLRKNPNVNFQCPGHHTALHSAVVYNNVAAAVLLLEWGADMTIIPIKIAFQKEYECPLLMALKRGESHEGMQLLFLEALQRVNWAGFDRVALANIARISQYAMMYSTPRVFFATKQVIGDTIPRNSAGLTPLMFTLRRVGLYQDDMLKCTTILNNVLEIVDEDPMMAWERYRVTDNVGSPSETLFPITGCTALGMLAFQIMNDRTMRDNIFMRRADRRNGAKSLHQTHFTQGNIITVTATTIAAHHNAVAEECARRNRDVMACMRNEFIPYLFARMLTPMRIALGMASHSRLGICSTCLVGKLNPDIMNTIFNALVRDITTSTVTFEHMLC